MAEIPLDKNIKFPERLVTDLSEPLLKNSSLYYLERQSGPGVPGGFGSTWSDLWQVDHQDYRLGSQHWLPEVRVGTGWDFGDIARGPGKSFYAVDNETQKLWWYRHRGGEHWLKRLDVDNGWYVTSTEPAPDTFIGIFADQQYLSTKPNKGATIYVVTAMGDLLWYRHKQDAENPKDWVTDSGKRVGNGWISGFHRVFSGGDGIIYLIADDGTLFWYFHEGHLTGLEEWKARTIVGSEWTQFRYVTSIGKGYIYAQDDNGHLYLYHHLGYQDGSNSWAPRKLVSKRFGGRQIVGNSVSLEVTHLH